MSNVLRSDDCGCSSESELLKADVPAVKKMRCRRCHLPFRFCLIRWPTLDPELFYVQTWPFEFFLVIFISFVLYEVVTKDNEATLLDIILFHIWDNHFWWLNSPNSKCQLHLSVNLLLLVLLKPETMLVIWSNSSNISLLKNDYLVQLELKLGLGGTSYEDFIRNMYLPLQLRWFKETCPLTGLSSDVYRIIIWYFFLAVHQSGRSHSGILFRWCSWCNFSLNVGWSEKCEAARKEQMHILPWDRYEYIPFQLSGT